MLEHPVSTDLLIHRRFFHCRWYDSDISSFAIGAPNFRWDFLCNVSHKWKPRFQRQIITHRGSSCSWYRGWSKRSRFKVSLKISYLRNLPCRSKKENPSWFRFLAKKKMFLFSISFQIFSNSFQLSFLKRWLFSKNTNLYHTFISY